MTSVRTLLGAKGLDFSILCLRSFVDASADGVKLTIHSDGSLTPEHMDLIRARVAPDCAFVLPEEAFETTASALARYPHLQKFAQRDVYAKKLLHTTLMETDPRARVIDSDIFFFRPVAGLFTRATGNQSLFMRDRLYAYSFTRSPKVRDMFPLARRVNSGIIDFPRAAFDLDFLEYGWRENLFAPGWTDQTMWAALARRTEAIWPERVVIPKKGEAPGDAIAWHIVSPVRRFFEPELLRATADAHRGDAVLDIKVQPFDTTHYPRYLLHHVWHSIDWRMQQMMGKTRHAYRQWTARGADSRP